MTLPPHLLSKYLARFDKLLIEGKEIHRTAQRVSGQYPDTYGLRLDNQRLKKWQTNSISLLDQVIPKSSVQREIIKNFDRLSNDSIYTLEVCISKLEAIKEDYEQGFLGDLTLAIESEIAADYMGQAEQLLAEGQSGKYDHVPAAVLAGAVLEKALRTLCSKQTPPIPTINSKGSPLTLNPLIDELKKAGVFNELKAKQLRAWADIRNASAHGEFDNFNRNDVERIIEGVSDFLSTYMV